MRTKIIILSLLLFFCSKRLLAGPGLSAVTQRSGRNSITFTLGSGFIDAQHQFEKGARNLGLNAEILLSTSRNPSCSFGLFFFQYKPGVKSYFGPRYFVDFAGGFSLKKNFLMHHSLSPFIQTDLGFGKYKIGEGVHDHGIDTYNYLDFFVNGGVEFYRSSGIVLKPFLKVHISSAWAVIPLLHSVGIFLEAGYRFKF